MLVGGKPEAGETPRQCAVREVSEELGVGLNADRLRDLGTFHSIAVNEGVPLTAHVFISDERVSPSVQAELAALRWVDPADPGDGQAPLNIDLVFPLLVSEGERRGAKDRVGPPAAIDL